MDISKVFIIDPITGQKSVSLTLLIVSFVGIVIAAGLEAANVIHTTSVLNELYFANAGLYFGRRIQTKVGNIVDK